MGSDTLLETVDCILNASGSFDEAFFAILGLIWCVS